MKKLLRSLTAFLVISYPPIQLVSCTFDFLGVDLSKLPDYDWKEKEPYFKNYNKIDYINKDTDLPSDGGTIDLSDKHPYIDYLNFLTGYKNRNGINTQAVTGVPLNSAFTANGNYRKDLGETKRDYLFEQVNSILQWSSSYDHDYPYNISDQKLLKTKQVAAKWVATQDPKVKSLNMGLLTKSTSGENTIVGVKRMFNYNFNNWQYVDNFVAWAGAIDEGFIVPPPADAVTAAHINGTKIFGNIYLDGYHGLTKSMLRDFVKRDDSGNYAIVNVLIKMAKEMGFDGWFWNNEPNGGAPNGLVMNSKVSIDIIKQFYDKVKNSSDPEIQALRIIPYKNRGNLQYIDNNLVQDQEAANLAEAADGLFLQDFYRTPNNTTQWIEKHPQYDKYDIYNMYNVGGWVGGKIYYNTNRIGTRNVNELTKIHYDPDGKPYTDPFKETQDMQLNKWTFGKENQNSLALFLSSIPTELSRDYLNGLKRPVTLQDDVYATIYQNYYDDMLYTGRNRFISNEDKGSTSWLPNADLTGMSYGVGDIKLENTVLFDNDKDELKHFSTNFSTGQGQKFVTNSGVEIDNYPWFNRRLVETQPTYKWDIREFHQNSDKLKQASDVKGFYDFNDVYRKGNSIALGSDYSSDGKILPTTIDQPILWNIFGTNYTNSNKEVSLVIKVSDENNQGLNYSQIQGLFTNGLPLSVTLGDTDLKEIPHKSLIQPTVKSLNKNWIKLTYDLGSINLSNNEKIAKLGLAITPTNSGKSTKVKINVGQFEINEKDAKTPTNSKVSSQKVVYLSDLSSQYVIYRDKKYSIRLNWKLKDPSQQANIYYYEVYLLKNNQFYRLGETRDTNYYVKNLDLDNDSKIIIKPVLYNNDNAAYQWWKVKL